MNENRPMGPGQSAELKEKSCNLLHHDIGCQGFRLMVGCSPGPGMALEFGPHFLLKGGSSQPATKAERCVTFFFVFCLCLWTS